MAGLDETYTLSLPGTSLGGFNSRRAPYPSTASSTALGRQTFLDQVWSPLTPALPQGTTPCRRPKPGPRGRDLTEHMPCLSATHPPLVAHSRSTATRFESQALFNPPTPTPASAPSPPVYPPRLWSPMQCQRDGMSCEEAEKLFASLDTQNHGYLCTEVSSLPPALPPCGPHCLRCATTQPRVWQRVAPGIPWRLLFFSGLSPAGQGWWMPHTSQGTGVHHVVIMYRGRHRQPPPLSFRHAEPGQ